MTGLWLLVDSRADSHNGKIPPCQRELDLKRDKQMRGSIHAYSHAMCLMSHVKLCTGEHSADR